MTSSRTVPSGANGLHAVTFRQIISNAFDSDDNMSLGADSQSITFLEEDSQPDPKRVEMGYMFSSSFGGHGGEGGGRLDEENALISVEV